MLRYLLLSIRLQCLTLLFLLLLLIATANHFETNCYGMTMSASRWWCVRWVLPVQYSCWPIAIVGLPLPVLACLLLVFAIAAVSEDAKRHCNYQMSVATTAAINNRNSSATVISQANFRCNVVRPNLHSPNRCTPSAYVAPSLFNLINTWAKDMATVQQKQGGGFTS